MPVHPSEFFYLRLLQSRAGHLRSTSHQGERLVLLLLFVWLWFFVGFVLVVFWLLVLFCGLVCLVFFTEPAFHPQLLAIR